MPLHRCALPLNKNLCPSLPPSERATLREKFLFLKALILPAALIFTCLGAILTGITTPTEGAAVGALGAVIFNIVCRRFSWQIFKDCSIATIKLSAMVAWMVACANSFGSIFAGIGGNRMIMDLALQMPGGKWGALFASMAFIFFLGMFLETAGLIMLAAPIVTPIIVRLGFDPLWWGIIFMTLLQCAYISPPFGLSLFYLKGITPEDISLLKIYRSGLPFLALQVIGLILMVLFPILGVWAAKML